MSRNDKNDKLYIVVPCYNEEENVIPISESIINELKKLDKYDYELEVAKKRLSI